MYEDFRRMRFVINSKSLDENLISALIDGVDQNNNFDEVWDRHYKKQEIVTLGAAVPVPPVRFSFDSLKPGELQAGCIGGTYDRYLPRARLDEPSEAEKLDPEYRSYYH